MGLTYEETNIFPSKFYNCYTTPIPHPTAKLREGNVLSHVCLFRAHSPDTCSLWSADWAVGIGLKCLLVVIVLSIGRSEKWISLNWFHHLALLAFKTEEICLETKHFYMCHTLLKALITHASHKQLASAIYYSTKNNKTAKLILCSSKSIQNGRTN